MARIAVAAVRADLAHHAEGLSHDGGMDVVRFVLFSDRLLTAFETALV